MLFSKPFYKTVFYFIHAKFGVIFKNITTIVKNNAIIGGIVGIETIKRNIDRNDIIISFQKFSREMEQRIRLPASAPSYCHDIALRVLVYYLLKRDVPLDHYMCYIGLDSQDVDILLQEQVE